MPNWCHNTITVNGPREALAAFAKAVAVEDRPLSFARLVPPPDSEVFDLADEARKVVCELCAGRGRRPVTAEEAEEWGCAFYPQADMPVVPFEERVRCNGCRGSGRSLPSCDLTESWYGWNVRNWGTKWDACFDGPLLAIQAEQADVELTVQAQGATITPDMLVYKFDTAWSPPEPWLVAIGPLFPQLEFELRWGDPAHGDAGDLRVRGKNATRAQLDIADVLAPEEMWF